MTVDLHMPLSPDRFDELADALGETPETVISLHLLRKRRCKVHLAGDPAAPAAVVIQADREPMGFGDDPNMIWHLLEPMDGWVCISVATKCALEMGRLISESRGIDIRYLQDVYHTLSTPARVFEHDAVRQLTPADLDLLESAPSWLRGSCFENPKAMLNEGIVAGAIVDGRLVSTAFTSALSAKFADIGVNTLATHRRRGLATAAASVVACRVQETGRTPIWSAGEHNTASLALARKIRFTEALRRTYVIPEPKTD